MAKITLDMFALDARQLQGMINRAGRQTRKKGELAWDVLANYLREDDDVLEGLASRLMHATFEYTGEDAKTTIAQINELVNHFGLQVEVVENRVRVKEDDD